MKRLPVWILAIFVAISALLLIVGWLDRDEAGYFPFIAGIAWTLFTLASIGERMKEDFLG